jgi:hypothetical protein
MTEQDKPEKASTSKPSLEAQQQPIPVSLYAHLSDEQLFAEAEKHVFDILGRFAEIGEDETLTENEQFRDASRSTVDQLGLIHDEMKRRGIFPKDY